MKRLLAVTVISVLAPFAPAGAQTLVEEIGYVDVRRISEESQEAAAANDTLEALRNERNAEITRRREALQAEQEKLLASETVLGAEAREEQVRLVQRLQVDLQRIVEDAQAELQRLQGELEASLRAKLLPAVLFVARERALKVVLRRDDPNLLWADPELDITDAVMARMDTPPPAGTTPAPPATPPEPAAPPPDASDLASWLGETRLLEPHALIVSR